MLVTNGILTHRYDEQPHEGMRLGRHLELDARSLAYTAPQPRHRIKPAEWLPAIPTLDQGQVGSCVGNASTYHLSQLYAQDLGKLTCDGMSLSQDAATNERFALAVYHEATVLDGFPGTYPPTDTGSSGLGAGRAMKATGLISSYVWATNARSFAGLLQHGGVIIGMPWYESFFSPDGHGFTDADPNWQASGVAGGHELYVEALEAWDGRDPRKCVIRFRNSWGPTWGDHGCGRIRLSTYNTLRTQIDVKQFLR